MRCHSVEGVASTASRTGSGTGVKTWTTLARRQRGESRGLAQGRVGARRAISRAAWLELRKAAGKWAGRRSVLGGCRVLSAPPDMDGGNGNPHCSPASAPRGRGWVSLASPLQAPAESLCSAGAKARTPPGPPRSAAGRAGPEVGFQRRPRGRAAAQLPDNGHQPFCFKADRPF